LSPNIKITNKVRRGTPLTEQDLIHIKLKKQRIETEVYSKSHRLFDIKEVSIKWLNSGDPKIDQLHLFKNHPNEMNELFHLYMTLHNCLVICKKNPVIGGDDE
jgi:hypothetical protein